jgi:hypothetical protein
LSLADTSTNCHSHVPSSVPSFCSIKRNRVASFLNEHVDYTNRFAGAGAEDALIERFACRYSPSYSPELWGASDEVRKIFEVWKHIYGEDSEGHLCLAYGRRPWAVKPGETKPKLVDFGQSFFSWPEEAEEAATEALRLSEEGYNVYHCAHLLDSRERKAYCAKSVRSLWDDRDEASLPEGFPGPTLTLESSPGRYQDYWRLDAEISPDEAQELNAEIARLIGADPGGCDLSQLLRVPLTKNYDYLMDNGEYPTVRLEEGR